MLNIEQHIFTRFSIFVSREKSEKRKLWSCAFYVTKERANNTKTVISFQTFCTAMVVGIAIEQLRLYLYLYFKGIFILRRYPVGAVEQCQLYLYLCIYFETLSYFCRLLSGPMQWFINYCAQFCVFHLIILKTLAKNGRQK